MTERTWSFLLTTESEVVTGAKCSVCDIGWATSVPGDESVKRDPSSGLRREPAAILEVVGSDSVAPELRFARFICAVERYPSLHKFFSEEHAAWATVWAFLFAGEKECRDFMHSYRPRERAPWLLTIRR